MLDHATAERLRAALHEIQFSIINAVHDARTMAVLVQDVREIGFDLIDQLEGVIR